MASIRPGTVVLVTSLAALTLIGFYLLYLLNQVLIAIFISILFATAIEPLVNRLRRGPFSRGQDILIVYLCLAVIVAVIGVTIVPTILGEVNAAVESLPRTAADLRYGLASVDNPRLRAVAVAVLGKVEQAPAEASAAVSAPENADQVVQAGRTLLEGVVSVITVFIVAFYWLLERGHIKRVLLGLLPAARRGQASAIWEAIEHKFGGWVRGQAILMLSMGLMAGLGYGALGLRYAVVLAVWASVAELVPMIGPIIGTAPAVIVALTQSPQLAVIVLIFGIVIQVIENNILVPRIMGHAVGISPLTVIIGLLVGTTLGGLVGALLAVPTAAALQVVFQEITAPSDAIPLPPAAAEPAGSREQEVARS